MHYGTPASIEAVEPYYTHIRRGRAPSREQLKELTDRYIAIGGPSPLTHTSRPIRSTRTRGLRANPGSAVSRRDGIFPSRNREEVVAPKTDRNPNHSSR